jgi:hypothetical protein
VPRGGHRECRRVFISRTRFVLVFLVFLVVGVVAKPPRVCRNGSQERVLGNVRVVRFFVSFTGREACQVEQSGFCVDVKRREVFVPVRRYADTREVGKEQE